MFHKLTLYLQKKKLRFLLILIIFLAFAFRTFNMNWDSGYYFHPDERAIIMHATPIALPSTLSEFLNPESAFNPNFFAYGNFPFYLLKFSADFLSIFSPQINEYGTIHFVGRTISALFDTATVLLIFFIAKKIKNSKLGLFAAFCYSIMAFPIQLSHFFAVDTILTFFLTSIILTLLFFSQHPSTKKAILLGTLFGLALATKISGFIIAPLILFIYGYLYYQAIRKKTWGLLEITNTFLYFVIFTILFFYGTQPYALIDIKAFISQTSIQSQMSKDPFVFPYTLQYVGKIPYIHEIYNITLFGVGIPLSLLSLVGIILLSMKSVAKKKSLGVTIITIYFWLYFIIFGSFAVGWMRYMLPIYPILAISAGYFLLNFSKVINKKFSNNQNFIFVVLAIVLLIYPLSFLSIYQKENTRIQASKWIHKNIPPGSKIALEHWDDSLPTYGIEKYEVLQLPLYDPDTSEKWNTINTSLKSVDYIVLASNRLHKPLRKLTNCEELPKDRCYPLTATYYRQLFSENLGFKKVAEFQNYPTIPFTDIHINDQSADESFTVYDHPEIIIFKKIP